MKKLIALSVAAGLATTAASAKVSFSLAIDALTNGGNPVNDSGLVVLVVDTGDDGFQLPSDGNLVSGNDEVVTYWDLADYDFETSKSVTLKTEGGVEWGSNWSEDDKLALFWFPTLDGSNMSPGADTIYGVFADAANLASGDAWFLPADGTLLHSLKLFTATASELVQLGNGDQPDTMGSTAFAVNNPPATGTPSTPSLGVANGAGKSTLTWTATGSTGGYIVQRKAPGGEWETIGVAGGNDTSFMDTNVKPGRQYEYRLHSIGTFASALSSSQSIIAERSVFHNVSARSRIVASDARTQMFGGVIVEGNDPTKNIILQAVGANYFTLNPAQGNPADFVSDPNITIYESGVATPVAQNNDWLGSEFADEIDGAMALGNAITLEADAAETSSTELISAKVNKGYSFATNSADGNDGDVLLAIFNADSDELGINDNRIVNLAARGFLTNQGGSLFAGGIIIKGNVPKEVLIMGWGPYLSGTVSPDLVGLTIENPGIDFYKGATVVGQNDDWQNQTATSVAGVTFETDADRIEYVIDQLGFEPLGNGSLDAALLVTLDPGAYTFALTGNGGTGIGMITIDEVEID